MWSLIPVSPAKAGIHCLYVPKRLEQVQMGPSVRWDDGRRRQGLNHVVVDPRHSSASWNPLSVRAETFGAVQMGPSVRWDDGRGRCRLDTQSPIAVIPAQAGIHCLCAPKRLEQVRMGPSVRWDDGWRWHRLECACAVANRRHSSASWNPLSMRAETFGAVQMGPSVRWDDGRGRCRLDYAVANRRHSSASWNPLSLRAETLKKMQMGPPQRSPGHGAHRNDFRRFSSIHLSACAGL